MTNPPQLPDDVRDLLFRYLELREESRDDAEEMLARLHESSPDTGSALALALERLETTGLVEEDEEESRRIGPWVARRRLARGGMGEVYLAERHDGVGAPVALKVLRREFQDDDVSRARFSREVEAVGRLRHLGIAALIEHGESDGAPWVAFELIEGVTLRGAVRGTRDIAHRDLVGTDFARALDGVDESCDLFQGSWYDVIGRIGRDVASALAHAHDHGIVHRDVKPSNVMITAEGRVVLLDFGLASFDEAERLTSEGARVGSLHYMAPEVVRDGHTYDLQRAASGDVYSLGVTLYELAARRLPFDAIDPERLAIEVVAGTSGTLTRHAPSVPPNLVRCIQCALSRDPRRRYSTAATMAADLNEFLAGRDVQADAPRLRDALARWARRHPARATAAAALALVTIAGPLTLAAVERAHSKETNTLNRKLSVALTNEQEARVDASDNARAALEAVNTLLRRIAKVGLEDIPGGTEVRRQMIDDAFEIVGGLPREGEFGERVAFVEGMLLRARADLARIEGELETALADYASHEELLRGLRAEGTYADSPAATYELGSLVLQRAGVLAELNRREDAIVLFDEGTALMRDAASTGWKEGYVEPSIAQAFANRADTEYALRRYDDAAASAAEAIEIVDSLDDPASFNGAAALAAAQAESTLTDLAEERGDRESAVAHARSAASYADMVLKLRPFDRLARRSRARSSRALAQNAIELRRFDEATRAIWSAHEMYHELVEDFPAWVAVRVELIDCVGVHAKVLTDSGEWDEGVVHWRRLIELWRSSANARHRDTGLALALSNFCNAIILHRGTDEAALREAMSLVEEAVELTTDEDGALRADMQNPNLGWMLRYNQTLVHARLGETGEASDALDEARSAAGSAAQKSPFCTRMLADGENEIWLALERSGASEEEVADARSATIDALELAVQAGYRNHAELSTSPFLEGLRDDPRFLRLLERID